MIEVELGHMTLYPNGPKWSQCLSADLIARLKIILQESQSIGPISFRLPKIHATAGGVLRHSTSVVHGLIDKYEPLIFKVGFTHNPVWRWSSKLYGYSWAKDKWSNMVVLYISDEPFGPAMLEAALIDKFGSNSAEH